MIFDWFKSKKSVDEVEFETLKRRINTWSTKRAEDFVHNVLDDDTKYKVIRNESGKISTTSEMPNQPVRDFFQIYKSCSQVYGDMSMSLNEVGVSEYRREYIRVSRGGDATEIVAKKGQNDIYEIDGSDDDFSEAPFPSIFHWLAFNACVVHKELEAKIDK